MDAKIKNGHRQFNFRFNGLKKKVVLEVEKSEIERMKVILPAKIIKEKSKNPKVRLEFGFDNMPF